MQLLKATKKRLWFGESQPLVTAPAPIWLPPLWFSRFQLLFRRGPTTQASGNYSVDRIGQRCSAPSTYLFDISILHLHIFISQYQADQAGIGT
jgi:hypothetical protein